MAQRTEKTSLRHTLLFPGALTKDGRGAGWGAEYLEVSRLFVLNKSMFVKGLDQRLAHGKSLCLFNKMDE